PRRSHAAPTPTEPIAQVATARRARALRYALRRACHGNDGQGLYSQDLIPPAVIAPPPSGPYPRSRLLTMLRRERGVMPHLAELDEQRLRNVVAYLRAAVFLAPQEMPAPVDARRDLAALHPPRRAPRPNGGRHARGNGLRRPRPT